ncbi:MULTISPECIES: hypothetical protein [unclassified Duganella]|uniref:hypothetical protein n=1 Tax=unclassified Duganella TaxID=2636909 RepID=UPI0018F3E03D|nr:MULTISPECIES: hypothetical protein [unclassified Duganella]
MEFNVFSVMVHLDGINSGKKIIIPGSPPTAEQIAGNPGLAEELERPMMLLIAAQR